MDRHEDAQSGQASRARRRKRRLAVALGSAVLMVTGLLQPLGLVGSAHADDHITGPLTDAINRNAKNVQDSLTAAQAAVTALTGNAQTFAGQLATILQGAPSDPAGALTALQGAATAELGSLAGVGLTQALTLASRVSTPTCSTLGALTAILPDVGTLNPAIFGPLAPTLAQLDAGISNALQTFYTSVFTKLLTPIALPGGAAALAPYLTLAQTLLSLLKMNWHTTYYPPGGGAPVVRDTPGFLGLPTFLDVDGHTGEDVCALFNANINTSNAAQSTLSQQIARLPFTGKLPLDIQGQFLSGTINAGYETKNSQAPASFITTTPASNTPVDTTLFKTGTTFDQTLGLATTLLGTPASLVNRLASVKPPTVYHFATSTPGGTGGTGNQYNYTASNPSSSFGYSSILTTVLGTATVASLGETPGATAFEYCTSTKSSCSNETTDTANEKGSLHLKTNAPVTVDSPIATGPVSCPLTATGVHLTGSNLYLAQDSTLSAATPGHVWLDSANQPLSGCMRAAAGMTGTFPTGFKALRRKATWQGTGAPPALTKTGTVTCPTGTSVKLGTTAAAFALDPYFCFLPPVSVVPTVTGDPYQGSVLTAAPTSWSPVAPNLPTLAYQWQRCDSSGFFCSNINANANGSTYTITAADLNSKLRVSVSGSNPDGSATVVSALTKPISLPPAPVIDVLPAISGTANVGRLLHASTGTWKNGTTGFAYQWQRCDGSGNGCTNITGATNADYTTTTADRSQQLVVVVKASNVGGTSAPATSTGFFIRPAPVNTTLPVIKDGVAVSTGLPVFQGDTLSTVNDAGNWNYADSFGYQWQRCDSGSCAPIDGATAATYKVTGDDVGDTLTVQVTGINPDPNSPTTALATATGTVIANALVPHVSGLVPDGPLYASTPSDHDTTYVGGDFDTVGPRVGGAGAVPATPTAADGSKTATLAALVSGGTVNAVAQDTTGGYFLGGNFTRALGTGCNAVAHIKADGTLDAAYCRPALSGEVRALDYVKGTLKLTTGTGPMDVLAVGGAFTDGANSNLMLLDPMGTVSAPVDQPDGAVNSIADDAVVAALATVPAMNFFFGGAFTHLGGTTALRLGAATISDPQTVGTAMHPVASSYPAGVDCAGGTCTTPEVKSVAWTTASLQPEIIFGGSFDRVYLPGSGTGVARRNAAAIFEAAPGAQVVGNWDPSPNGPITAITTIAGVLTPGAVYLAGDFTQLGSTTGFKGLAEYGIANVPASGSNPKTNGPSTAGTAVTSSPNTVWKPSVDNGQVLSMIPADSAVYLAGSFTSIGGTVRHRLAAVTVASATAPTLTAWDPNAGQTVRSISRFKPTGTGSIFIGGDYLVLGGSTRNNLAELKKDGTFTTWAPAGTNGPVRALAATAGTVYAGGEFSKSGSAGRANLAAFDTGAGAATTAWNPGTDGKVQALQVAGGTAYVGGAFGLVGGSTRNNLAAVDNTGAVTTWNPNVTGTLVRAIAVDGTTAYVGGEFTAVGSAARANVAAIDTASGNALTAWNPGTDGPVYALALNSATVYLGGKFATVGGVARSNAAGVARTDGSVTDWAPQADDTVRTLAVLGSKVFAGGDFATIGGASRPFAAQLLDDTGLATDGFTPALNGRVYSIAISAAGGVGFFGSFTSMNIPATATNSYAFYGG